jgi:hypothetical protein
MKQFPPQPQSIPIGPFQIFSKIRGDKIFISQGAPPVSTTPVANFATSFASVVDTDGKFAAGVNDTRGNLPPVSMTPAANLQPVSMTQLANNVYYFRLLRP